mgnify:CR=1 FL=1
MKIEDARKIIQEESLQGYNLCEERENRENEVVLKKENEKLKKELKEYKDIVFNSAMNRPHPAESMLKLMNEGHMTIHPKKE